MAKHIVKLFSPPGSPTTLVFSHQMRLQNYNGVTPKGAKNRELVSKVGDFQQISRCISETIQDRALVTVEWE